MMHRVGLFIIATLMLAAAIPAIIAEDGEAAVMDPCTLHFDFQPGGQSWIPARCGMVPDPDSIAVETAMGTWHLENGDPWDPTAPLPEYIPGGVLELIIDERPDPPAPDPPAPEPTPPTPTPTPTPDPEPSGNDDKTTKYALISVGAGAAVIAVLVLGYFATRRH